MAKKPSPKHHGKAKLVHFGDSFERARNEPHVLRPMKIVRALDDHAISIQKDGGSERGAVFYRPGDAGVDSIHEETRRCSTAAQIAW